MEMTRLPIVNQEQIAASDSHNSVSAETDIKEQERHRSPSLEIIF